jgi:hypothetical protein
MTIRAWLRVAVTGTVATTLGLVVGLAASRALSYAWDRLRTVQSVEATPARLATSRQGLAVGFESVDVDRAAAFEAAVFEAEQRSRRQLPDEDEPSRWFLFRSRTPTVDGSILYLLWFEPHADLERTALSGLFPAAAPSRPRRAWPDHELVTFVPVMPIAPGISPTR